MKDNPSLTVREVNARNPIRLVIDQNLRLPKNLSVFNNDAKTFILTKKPILPSKKEIDLNNRSRSAKLRVAKRTYYTSSFGEIK